ncbi:MAG TPA: isoprenylcysteine carboxylmethyltransferase family protein [Ignavibacteria bacterium]|nr:isoprenylcysteine carboxylmethyltransferase family protein [Ignavibacteria bacterium]
MDPINIIIGLNIFATLGANLSGAKKGLKSKITVAKEKPQSYLQKVPIMLSTVTLIVLIFSIFQVGTIAYTEEYNFLRIIALLAYLLFSWIQIWSYKTLGEQYSQEVLIFRTHKIVNKGLYRVIRHPQYLSQIVIDLGGAFATLSYVLLPLAIIQIPLLILRARFEEKLMEKHFKQEFIDYKKRTSFILPFPKL